MMEFLNFIYHEIKCRFLNMKLAIFVSGSFLKCLNIFYVRFLGNEFGSHCINLLTLSVFLLVLLNEHECGKGLSFLYISLDISINMIFCTNHSPDFVNTTLVTLLKLSL